MPMNLGKINEAAQRKIDACIASDPRHVKVVFEAFPRDVTGKSMMISHDFGIPAGLLKGMGGDK
eukprot:CAMPEP_0198222844 /NCGR_PEP_ID=MMETSP1445-20131203/89965_1 /TAXON_ID=36898 /ORGANISM="Pyramimonas sp., Strain CCMP2087" /LENGTH=63 /DNA_ID=CAMNT_0043901501 /DNA_START=62 /DNA_END=250 /DNA_ORIENTATION=+